MVVCGLNGDGSGWRFVMSEEEVGNGLNELKNVTCKKKQYGDPRPSSL